MNRAAQRNGSIPPRASAVVGFDRQSRVSAEAVMEAACPDLATRQFLMERLLQSIAIAERLGPNSWAVTLFMEGFRLNVGQVEAFTYKRRLAYLFMLGGVSDRAHTVGEIIPTSFRSMPQPQSVFIGSAKELQRIHAALAQAHKSFVQTAAVTAKGKPRRCSYSRYHSPGLYHYAVNLVPAHRASGGRRGAA